MEQASSVEKAVAKAWERAEYPASFSVKILEKPKKNFFGITTTSAKIALFFSEATTKQRTRKTSQTRKELKKKYTTPQSAPRTVQAKKDRAEWNPAMIDAAQLWVKNVLKHLNKQDTTFTTLRKGTHLVFLFNRSFFDDNEQEKLLFSSFALLMLKSLRIKFNSIRNLKVVFQQKT